MTYSPAALSIALTLIRYVTAFASLITCQGAELPGIDQRSPHAVDQTLDNIQSVTHTGEPIEARQWDVCEIRFMVDQPINNAVDVDFSATFQQGTDSELTIPGYFDDESFVIRFTPPVSGAWTYTTHSIEKKLDEQSGSLVVQTARPGRKGGITIAPSSPLRFQYQNGDGYFPIAFEADWLFALDAENEADIPKTRQFINTLAHNGFNQVVLNVFAYDVNWKKDDRLLAQHEYGSPNVFPFGGSNTQPEHDRLNIDYFQKLDRVIGYLDQQGIAAHLMIYVWNKRVNWPAAESAADNRYFDYVVKRYQAFPNVVWDISKEALGYGHSDVNYISRRIQRLRSLDAYKRLVTVHDYSYCRRFTENVDFISVQLWQSELHSVMQTVRSDMPGKPILNIEHGGYERGPYMVFNGNYTSPEVCLERAYQCVFAGTFPTHYWQGAAWNVFVHDIESLPKLTQPRLEFYRHMRTLVERYSLGKLVSGEKKSNAGFSLHNNDDLYVYYVPKECEFIGTRLPKKLRGKSMTGTWFNPFDGSFSIPERQIVTQWPAFAKPPGEGFRVLIVDIIPTSE